jgi:hypothetical protein
MEEDYNEICTPVEILAKKFDPELKCTVYLVSWFEYPGEHTWEPIENL